MLVAGRCSLPPAEGVLPKRRAAGAFLGVAVGFVAEIKLTAGVPGIIYSVPATCPAQRPHFPCLLTELYPPALGNTIFSHLLRGSCQLSEGEGHWQAGGLQLGAPVRTRLVCPPQAGGLCLPGDMASPLCPSFQAKVFRIIRKSLHICLVSFSSQNIFSYVGSLHTGRNLLPLLPAQTKKM